MTPNTNIALTDARVRDAVVPGGKNEIYLRDNKQRGLALRVRASGSKSFVYLTTRPGMKGSFPVTIGSAERVKLADARKHAAMLAGERAKGIDLSEANRKKKQDAIKARKQASGVVTLNALIGGDECRYARARQREGIKNWAHELCYLRRNLLAGHRDTDIREITRRDVMVAVNRLKEKDKHGAADEVYKHAFTFLGWAVDEGYIDVNPLAGGRRRKGSKADRLEREAKGRALSDHEIAPVWTAAGEMGTFGLLVRFCMLAGTRRGEAAKLKWSDVLNDRIVIAAQITKMGKAHAIPRTKLLDEVLEAAQQFQRASSEYIFLSARTGKTIEEFPKRLDRLVREAGVDRFTMHDTRRTCRTILGQLGISTELQRACIGQAANNLDARYDRHHYWKERCHAFGLYHHHIAKLLRGDNVVELHPAKVA